MKTFTPVEDALRAEIADIYCLPNQLREAWGIPPFVRTLHVPVADRHKGHLDGTADCSSACLRAWSEKTGNRR